MPVCPCAGTADKMWMSRITREGEKEREERERERKIERKRKRKRENFALLEPS